MGIIDTILLFLATKPIEGKLTDPPRRLTKDELHKIFKFPDDWTTESLSENQYWPGDNDLPKHRDVMADLTRSLQPLVTATQTAVFVIGGPAGVLTSAGIGLIWNLITPGSTSQYQEDFVSMMGKALSNSFEEQAFSSARSTLDTFSKSFQKTVLNIKPQSVDDIGVTKERLRRMIGDVGTGGALTMAAADVKERLPWFNPSAHCLLVACLDAILQNYQMVLVSWEEIATMSLNRGDITNYNEAKREVSNILDSVDGLFEQYKAEIEGKITDLKKERLEKCKITTEDSDRSLFTDSRNHSLEKFHYRGFVLDQISKRQSFYVTANNPESLAKSMENIYKSVSDMMTNSNLKENGDLDDTYLDEILAEALKEYKRRLPVEMDKSFKELLECVDGIIKRVSTTIQRKEGRYPLKDSPKSGPALVVSFFKLFSIYSFSLISVV
ncbi:hypothetical protein EST38_g14083 [Candolleomyces aberdarensis]|uniref:Uncharacterized protein n=1 Tax=Candolleomyces aberdarensis TaxID=2316362 RepID=A0A4Q2CZB5_9AGAR|nr:hypothetical protein EST38_g14083 [Candolleomyces aberdarensis]